MWYKVTTKMNVVFKSKFIKVIKTLSEEELKSFENWLKSPWCNSNKNLIRLLGKLKKYYPHFENNKLTKEKLFKQILPHGKFSNRRMNNLLSEAYLALEKFLIFQNLSKNQNLQKDLLTKELQKRHLDDWFFAAAEKEIARLEKKDIKDWEDHLDLLRLNRRVYHHPTASKRMQPNVPTIVKMGEHLDLVFLLEKATIINEKIFRNRILKNENHEIETELKKWLVMSEGIEQVALDFYKRRFAYTAENMLKAYFKLRADFLERFEEMNEKEQKIHLISLLNDTNILIKATLLDITAGLLLYKLGLKTGIIFHQGKLTINTYVVIVAASNTAKNFDFTSTFIQIYTEKLEYTFQSDALNWAKAHTAYNKGNLKSSLDILLSHEFRILYFRRVSRVLTTQIYFELYLNDISYESYLFSFFDSFEKWLLRLKTLSKLHIKSYLRFIQICRILAKSYTDVNFVPSKIEKLLVKETNIQAYFWLSQKIEQVILLKSRGHPYRMTS